MNGVKKAGIPMTRKQLKKLVRVLDTDNDGTIDYGEMIAIKRDDVFDFYHKKKVYKKDDQQLQSFKSAQLKKPWVNSPKPLYQNEAWCTTTHNLHVNEILFSYERKNTKIQRISILFTRGRQKNYCNCKKLILSLLKHEKQAAKKCPDPLSTHHR